MKIFKSEEKAKILRSIRNIWKLILKNSKYIPKDDFESIKFSIINVCQILDIPNVTEY